MFSQGLINGKTMDMHRVDERGRLGATEIWQIENVVGMDHPFHLHGFQFQVLDRNGVPEPFRAWKDMVNVRKHETVRFIVRFDDYPGKWMYHCHILDHEDMGMMGILEVHPTRRSLMKHVAGRSLRYAGLGGIRRGAGRGGRCVDPVAATARRGSAPSPGDVARGRYSVITHACGDCHGGFSNPASPGWLAGVMVPDQEFKIPPSCAWTPGAKPCFTTRPRNLTPDNATGLGRFTERQIFNALKYGLRPEDTPDVDITSTTPGKGNFPLHPHYLAPPMPWTTWRHMPEPGALGHRGLPQARAQAGREQGGGQRGPARLLGRRVRQGGGVREGSGDRVPDGERTEALTMRRGGGPPVGRPAASVFKVVIVPSISGSAS